MGLTIRRTVASISLPALAAVAALLPAAAQAETIKVPATGSTASIQAAINAASPGDTISVAPGTYTGPTVNVNKDGITITRPPAAVIDADRQRIRDHRRHDTRNSRPSAPTADRPGLRGQRLQDQRPDDRERRGDTGIFLMRSTASRSPAAATSTTASTGSSRAARATG